MAGADRAELEVAEYVLGLDALGVGLGARAGELYRRCLARDVYPLVRRQKALLELGVACVENPLPGEKPSADVERQLAELDGQVEAAWRRCLEQLQTLWLTEGPQPEEEIA